MIKKIDDNVEDFEGFNEVDTAEIDFFGEKTVLDNEDDKIIPSEDPETEEKKDTKKKETAEDEKDPTERDKEVEESLTFLEEDDFKDVNEKIEKEIQTEEKKKEEAEEETKVLSKAVEAAIFLKDRNLIEYELEEGEELTEEKAEAIMEDSFDERVEQRIEEYFEGYPEILKQLNKYVIDGGNVTEFLGTILSSNSSGITEDIDLENTENQKLIIREGLKSEGYEPEDIDLQIQSLEDSGKLSKFSNFHFNKWKKKKDLSTQQLAKQKQEEKENEKIRRRNLKIKVKDFLEEEKEIVSGLKITKKDKSTLPSYMVDRNISLEGGSTTTAMNRDLMNALADEKKAIIIAKLLKSDFDFSIFEANVETKVAEKVKNNIRRTKGIPSGSARTGSSRHSKKTLADYF